MRDMGLLPRTCATEKSVRIGKRAARNSQEYCSRGGQMLNEGCDYGRRQRYAPPAINMLSAKTNGADCQPANDDAHH